jgi:hypothetical protein
MQGRVVQVVACQQDRTVGDHIFDRYEIRLAMLASGRGFDPHETLLLT